MEAKANAPNILIVDDEIGPRESLRMVLKVGDRELVRERKDGLQERSSLHVDQNGGIGDENHWRPAAAGSSMRRLSSRTVIFSNSAVFGSEIAPSASAR